MTEFGLSITLTIPFSNDFLKCQFVWFYCICGKVKKTKSMHGNEVFPSSTLTVDLTFVSS